MIINDYKFGSITIDGKQFTNDVQLINGEVIGWWRGEGHLVKVDDLENAIKASPEVIIIGKGYSGICEVDPEVGQHMDEKGIELIKENTGKAQG